MESTKTYKNTLLTAVGMIVIIGGAFYFFGDRTKEPVQQVKARVHAQLVTGQVTKMYEGENKAVYSFYVPEAATTTTLMDGALLRVKEDGAPYMAAYLSYEGGRGYVAEEYINRVIAPQVRVIEAGATSTIGSYTWMKAESENSEWHIAQVGDGQWLMIVESPKANHERVLETLEDLKVE